VSGTAGSLAAPRLLYAISPDAGRSAC